MLSINIVGGLGNQLFCLAAGQHFAAKEKKQFYLQTLKCPETIHSTINYFDNIFKNFKYLYTDKKFPSMHVNEYNIPKYFHDNVILEGYFQKYEYIPDDFVSKLIFDKSIEKKYEGIRDGYFIHIRGTDFVNNPFHNLGLSKYYEYCLKKLKDKKFYLFTNDLPYAKTVLNVTNFTFVDENELDSLYLMSICKGGICANSTFSWWGAYLNKDRKIYFPSKLYKKDMDFSGYYVPGWKIIEV
jgi:hypothetical protein